MSIEDRKVRKVGLRKEQFTNKQATKICQEQATQANPYITENASCYGYDLLQLMEKRSFADVLYLILTGNLPTDDQAKLLERLMIAFINPGPRHPATRSAMNAGIGKTDISHILPISLNILSGTHLGANEIEMSMRFLRKNHKKDPVSLVEELINRPDRPAEGDWHLAPGFGNRFGGVEQLVENIAAHLAKMPAAGLALEWGTSFAKALKKYDMGWLATGVVAATLADLKFQPKAGIGLFQIISSPGLFAHGLELSNKPFSAMPFPEQKDYIIER